jgi:hypothetical protein
MRKLVLILLISLPIIAFAQFPEKHIIILTKINCALSEAWIVSAAPDLAHFNDSAVSNIEMILLPYRSIDKDERCSIVISVYDKKYTKQVKTFYRDNETDTLKFSGQIIETKSYVVFIGYFKDRCEIDGKMAPKALSEINKFFDDNWKEL